jgi:hypothetical protein
VADPLDPAMNGDTIEAWKKAVHHGKVIDRINKHIFSVNLDPRFAKSTISEKIVEAWSRNIAERDRDTGDDINVGADADYYFAARKIVAADHGLFSKFSDPAVKANPGTGLAAIDKLLAPVALLGYDLWKTKNAFSGHPERSRTDANKPNAPAFRGTAYTWVMLGAQDGFSDRGQDVATIIPFTQNSE